MMHRGRKESAEAQCIGKRFLLVFPVQFSGHRPVASLTIEYGLIVKECTRSRVRLSGRTATV